MALIYDFAKMVIEAAPEWNYSGKSVRQQDMFLEFGWRMLEWNSQHLSREIRQEGCETEFWYDPSHPKMNQLIRILDHFFQLMVRKPDVVASFGDNTVGRIFNRGVRRIVLAKAMQKTTGAIWYFQNVAGAKYMQEYPNGWVTTGMEHQSWYIYRNRRKHLEDSLSCATLFIGGWNGDRVDDILRVSLNTVINQSAGN